MAQIILQITSIRLDQEEQQKLTDLTDLGEKSSNLS